MQNIIFAFTCIAPLFIQILLGAFLRRRKVIDQRFIDTSSDFVFQYLFPLVMFRQIYQTDIISNINPVFVGYGILVCIVIGALLWLIAPHFIKDRQTCGAYMQGSYRSNCVLMGVSLSINVFGESGAMPTIMLLPFASIVFNVLSLSFLTAFSPDRKKMGIRSILPAVVKNPIVIGAVSGIIVSLLHIPFPPFVSEVIDDLAAMATPLALICLGGQMKLKNLYAKPALILSGSFIKLVLSPLIAIVPALIFFEFTSYEMGALFFIFGSSTAISSFVMAKVMKSDDNLASLMVIYSTIFSGITMFLWIFALKNFHII